MTNITWVSTKILGMVLKIFLFEIPFPKTQAPENCVLHITSFLLFLGDRTCSDAKLSSGLFQALEAVFVFPNRIHHWMTNSPKCEYRDMESFARILPWELLCWIKGKQINTLQMNTGHTFITLFLELFDSWCFCHRRFLQLHWRQEGRCSLGMFGVVAVTAQETCWRTGDSMPADGKSVVRVGALGFDSGYP